MKKSVLLLFLLFFICPEINANEADVVNVTASHLKNNTWRFDVTVKHADEGWKHYVNEWVILSPDGKVLAKRTLYHPHVHEQPFTRNIQGVKIPGNIHKVRIVAHDTVDGIGGQTMEVNLDSLEVTISDMEIK